MVIPTRLRRDKEPYIVATAEIEGAHGLPRHEISIVNKLQKGLHIVGKRGVFNGF